jgi:hypothetical protein
MSDQESGGKTQERKSLFDELIEDDFFKPATDGILPLEKNMAVAEANPRAKLFLEEDPPVTLLEEDSEQLIPKEEIPVRSYAVREGRKGIDRKKITLVAGGSLVSLACLITFGVKFLGVGEGQNLVEVPLKQRLIQPHVSTGPATPPPPPKRAEVKPTDPLTIVVKPVSQAVSKYTLEIGRYSKNRLVNPQKKLIRLGLSTFTISEKRTTEVKYVAVEHKLNKDEARAASIKLDFVGGIKNKIISQNDGTFTVQSGPFSSMSKAVETKNKISELGFTARIDFRSVTSVVYRLMVGKFATLSDADRTSELLQQNGFAPKVRKL